MGNKYILIETEPKRDEGLTVADNAFEFFYTEKIGSGEWSKSRSLGWLKLANSKDAGTIAAMLAQNYREADGEKDMVNLRRLNGETRGDWTDDKD